MAEISPPACAAWRRSSSEEVGWAPDPSEPVGALVLEEIDRARRPHVHERRVVSSGVVVAPSTDPATWAAGHAARDHPRASSRSTDPDGMRLFADGLSSWLVRHLDERPDEWMVFDRPSGSERDLVVIAEVLGATVVQRHPTGVVRVVDDRGRGSLGRRARGTTNRRSPSWIDTVTACDPHGDVTVVRALLEFAVHDLGSRGIGALLDLPARRRARARRSRRGCRRRRRCRSVGRPRWRRCATPSARSTGPRCSTPTACCASSACASCRAPRPRRRSTAYRGMRHTSARRYSYDDPTATVIVVSEDGPVSVLRKGERARRRRRSA